jgi:hypothetical protein
VVLGDEPQDVRAGGTRRRPGRGGERGVSYQGEQDQEAHAGEILIVLGAIKKMNFAPLPASCGG